MPTSESDWVLLSLVGINLRKLDPSFDSHTYGYNQLRKLIVTAPDEFELRRDGLVESVRLKQDGTSSEEDGMQEAAEVSAMNGSGEMGISKGASVPATGHASTENAEAQADGAVGM